MNEVGEEKLKTTKPNQPTTHEKQNHIKEDVEEKKNAWRWAEKIEK